MVGIEGRVIQTECRTVPFGWELELFGAREVLRQLGIVRNARRFFQYLGVPRYEVQMHDGGGSSGRASSEYYVVAFRPHGRKVGVGQLYRQQFPGVQVERGELSQAF